VYAVAWLLAAGSPASCGNDHPARGADTGTISLELVAQTAGATYHLRMASFAIAGPSPATTTTTVTTDSADSEAKSLTVKLAAGHYTMMLADGWALYRGGGDAGAEVRVSASLVSPNPASFDVTTSMTTFVPFRFATDGLVITTGPTGTVEISAEVNEEHGLALLAGDHTQAGSADGVGAAARFDTPTTLVSDGQGNLYINDSHNLTIRKLAVATGQVTTVAGSPGQAGYTDGVGSAARFVFPYGMALDRKGNLFISDQFHLRRLIVATGEVIDLKGITVDSAGTPLAISSAVAVDNTGAPLVLDATLAASVALRRVDLESGTTSIITNVTSAVYDMTAFQVPAQDLVLPYLDMYLAEGALTRIENIRFATDASGFQIGGAADLFSFAGHDGNPGAADGRGPNAQFLRPGAITNDGGENLFVTDAPNGTIRKIVVPTGDVTTVVGQAGTTGGPTPGPLPAVLGRPFGVAWLPNGALAIADGNAIYIARF